jgi:superfamily I DNA/RNA helicase
LRGEIYTTSNKSSKIHGSIEELIKINEDNKQSCSQIIKQENYVSHLQTFNEKNIPAISDVLDKVEIIEFSEEVNNDEFQTEEFLIEIDELNLIGIPENYHKQILDSSNLAGIEKLDIPKKIINRVLDYITNPNHSHIGKLYTLSEGDDFSAVAKRPLRDFMISLDENQKSIIKKIGKGHFIVTGKAGTGKTLVGLYWLIENIENETASVFNNVDKSSFMFISYVNSLVNTSQSVFDSIIRKNDAIIKFSTLDSFIAKELYGYKLGDVVYDGTLKFRLKTMTMDKMKQSSDVVKINAVQRVENKGIDFLMEEIEKAIEANDIKTLEAYLSFERKGRKKPLQKLEREAIWKVYEDFRSLCIESKKYTWSGKRQFYLHLIQSGQLIPRKIDYLVLDESQDMSLVSIRIINHISRNLLLLNDDGQSIYSKFPFTWKDVGHNLKFNKGNSFNLKMSYRMTKQNLKALESLRNDVDSKNTGITAGVFEGEKPFWLDVPLEKHNEIIVDIVREITEKNKINSEQIAIILRQTQQFSSVSTSLRNYGFEVDIFDKQRPIDINGNAVHIINAHSAKGLEFPFVIVPYISDDFYPFKNNKLSNEPLEDEFISMEQRLLYVALSRAQYRLWMLSDNLNPSRFLSKLDAKDWIKDKNTPCL